MTGTEKQQERLFLDVRSSLLEQQWVHRLDQAGENLALAMSQKQGIPELLARVLAGRGVEPDDAPGFLDPTLKDLMPDPTTLQDMETAAERIAKAISAREKIGIFGDYDVDGAASAALLTLFLEAFGCPSETHIPDRIFEGYGPNPDAIDRLIDEGARLIVTVDCGSTSAEALARANDRNIDVVVLDHHQMGSEAPDCLALVNPNRNDDLSGLGYLCAAGVVFMALVAIRRVLRERGDQRANTLDLLSMLDLVALATVCDVVPLHGLNRAFVVKGLLVARQMGNHGLAALMKVAGVDGPLSPYHLGFMIGPRINAGGRIGDASLGSRLLTISDEAEAVSIAENLNRLNQERQAMEAEILAAAEAEALAEYGSGEGPPVLVTAGDGWHPGIVGIIAARLKEKFKRPAFAIAFDPNGKGTGSGRSIAGFDLGRMVRGALDEGLLEKGGGHAMAAGLTVQRSNLGAMRAYFDDYAAENVGRLLSGRALKVDGALSARGATLAFADQLEKAGPYGAGHAQPLFVLPDHRLTDARIVGRNHVSMKIADVTGTKMEAIAFRVADTDFGKALMNGRGNVFHIAGSLSVNHWQGRSRVQLRVVDAANSNQQT